MIATLEFLATELRVNISTICRYIRTKTYPQNSKALLDAISNMVFYTVLVDELSNLLYGYHDVANSLRAFSAGEQYDEFFDKEPTSIYTYCLRQFNGEFMLGSATAELTAWVSWRADDNQTTRRDFYLFFPDADIKVIDVDELGAIEFRDASDEEKFKLDAEAFLQNIEQNNALWEFNRIMQQVKVMLEREKPVNEIISVLPSAKKQ